LVKKEGLAAIPDVLLATGRDNLVGEGFGGANSFKRTPLKGNNKDGDKKGASHQTAEKVG